MYKISSTILPNSQHKKQIFGNVHYANKYKYKTNIPSVTNTIMLNHFYLLWVWRIDGDYRDEDVLLLCIVCSRKFIDKLSTKDLIYPVYVRKKHSFFEPHLR